MQTSSTKETAPINAMDAAICTITQDIDPNVLDIGIVKEIAHPADHFNAMVQKRGRTTKLTQNGQIVSVNTSSIAIDYGSKGGAPAAYAIISPCFMIWSTDGQPFVQGGDSGSLIFLQEKGHFLDMFPVVGLLFGESVGTPGPAGHYTALASDIKSVFDALNLDTGYRTL